MQFFNNGRSATAALSSPYIKDNQLIS